MARFLTIRSRWLESWTGNGVAELAVSRTRNFIILLIVALVLTAAISLYATLQNSDLQYQQLASAVGSSFFQAVVTMRDWNTRHQGVYLATAPDVQPNEYLVDPLRDVTSTQGLRLTKVNHAQMTRMISELLDQAKGIHIHLTSLTPIRPQNFPTPWERDALAAFAVGSKEKYGLQKTDAGASVFRYMAPLIAEASCLTCHPEHKSANEIRGGISVSFSYAPFQALKDADNRRIWSIHLAALFAALIPALFLGRKLVHNVSALQATLERVRQLEGLVPICASCKKIRTQGADADQPASWVPVERFIEERTRAEFTHGLCPDCREKLYPGLLSGRKQ